MELHLVARALEPYINKFIYSSSSRLPSYWNEDSNTIKLILRHRDLVGISYLPDIKYVRGMFPPYQLCLCSAIGPLMVFGTEYRSK